MKPPTSLIIPLLLSSAPLQTKAWFSSGQLDCRPPFLKPCRVQTHCGCQEAQGFANERHVSQQKPGQQPIVGELQVFCLRIPERSPSLQAFMHQRCLNACTCIPDGWEKASDPLSGTESDDESDSTGKKRKASPERGNGGKRGRYNVPWADDYAIEEDPVDGLDEMTAEMGNLNSEICEVRCSSYATCKSSSSWNTCTRNRVCVPEKDEEDNWIFGLGKCMSATKLGIATLSGIGRRGLASPDVECLCNGTYISRECCTAEGGLV